MSIDPTKLLAQSEVRLFGWLVGQPATQTYASDEEPKEGARSRESARSQTYATAEEPKEGAGLRESARSHRHHTDEEPSAAFSPYDKGTVIPGAVLEAFEGSDSWLANVHAFSHEGRYTQFRAPALFLVPHPGDPVYLNGDVEPARLGLAQLDQKMVFARDLRFWTYDRSAHTVRLDLSAGTVQRLVIDLETSGAQGRRIDLVGQESSWMARLGQGHY
jgi:hypothetical protein